LYRPVGGLLFADHLEFAVLDLPEVSWRVHRVIIIEHNAGRQRQIERLDIEKRFAQVLADYR
jgi:hypothetical protein